jgi:hypothetical protein
MILLYPCGLKPITGAHIALIKDYLTKYNFVNKIIIFIGPNKRDFIDQELAYELAINILSDLPVEIIKTNKSPILYLYSWIEDKNREINNYAMISSSKGLDYKRSLEFTKNYTIKKYKNNLQPNVKVVNIDTLSPIIFKGRNDIYNETPISASIIRKDLLNNNYEMFKTGYPNINEDKIQYIWNKLKDKLNNKNI